MWAVDGLEVEIEGESVGVQLGGSDVDYVPEAT